MLTVFLRIDTRALNSVEIKREYHAAKDFRRALASVQPEAGSVWLNPSAKMDRETSSGSVLEATSAACGLEWLARFSFETL